MSALILYLNVLQLPLAGGPVGSLKAWEGGLGEEGRSVGVKRREVMGRKCVRRRGGAGYGWKEYIDTMKVPILGKSGN